MEKNCDCFGLGVDDKLESMLQFDSDSGDDRRVQIIIFIRKKDDFLV